MGIAAPSGDDGSVIKEEFRVGDIAGSGERSDGKGAGGSLAMSGGREVGAYAQKRFPYNVEAEAACIGCILIKNDLADELMEQLGPEDFYDGRHRLIMESIVGYRTMNGAAAFDVVVISDDLHKKKLLKKAGDITYINRLIDAAPATANLVRYVAIVRRDALLRRIISLCEATITVAQKKEAPDKVLDILQQRAFDLLTERKSDYEHIHPLADKLLDALERGVDSGKFAVPSQYKDLDKVIIGLQPANLIIVGGRTGMGKTAFALSLLLRTALPQSEFEAAYPLDSGGASGGGGNSGGIAVGYFSLEMSKRDIAMRILSSYGKIPLGHFKQDALKDESWPQILSSVDAMKELGIYIDDTPGISINELIAKARRMVLKDKVQLVIVDYLQLIGGNDMQVNREQQISMISKRLKNLARELEIPVIALTQLNRAVEQRDAKEPRLSDIRESGAIEQDADIVLLLHRPALDNIASTATEDDIGGGGEQQQGRTYLYIAKNRNGPTGVVDLDFEGQYVRFVDYFK